MKKSILLFICFVPLIIFSQESAVTSEYQTPKKKLIQSNWDKLVSNSELKIYFRISAIGNYSFLDMRIAKNNTAPFKIENGQELVFYFPEKDTLIINSASTEHSCIGCGSVSITSSQFSGLEVSYILDKNEIKKLESFIPSMFAINTSNETIAGTITGNDYNRILKAIIITED